MNIQDSPHKVQWCCRKKLEITAFLESCVSVYSVQCTSTCHWCVWFYIQNRWWRCFDSSHMPQHQRVSCRCQIFTSKSEVCQKVTSLQVWISSKRNRFLNNLCYHCEFWIGCQRAGSALDIQILMDSYSVSREREIQVMRKKWWDHMSKSLCQFLNTH